MRETRHVKIEKETENKNREKKVISADETLCNFSRSLKLYIKPLIRGKFSSKENPKLKNLHFIVNQRLDKHKKMW